MSDTSATHAITAVTEHTRPTRQPIAVTFSGATRYLAAAAYTDKRFRDRAIDIDQAEFRAVAPELGIDAALVVEHCRVARRREALRDAALCFVLIVLATTGIFGELAEYPDLFAEILDYHSALLLGFWALAAAIVFTEVYLREHLTLTRRFGRNFSCGSTEDRVSSLTKKQNVVVYGAFSPFVGSGFDLGGWSFTVNLEQSTLDAEESSPEPFEIGELYDALKEGFERLAIDGLSISDRLFVDGRAIREDPRFLPQILSCPVTNVDPELVDVFRARPGKTVRHYLCLEIADWNGELVLSTFIRLQKSDSKLFIEIEQLPPASSEGKILRARQAHADPHGEQHSPMAGPIRDSHSHSYPGRALHNGAKDLASVRRLH